MVRARRSLDTRNWEDSGQIPVGARFEVAWRDVTDPDTPNDDLRVRGFEGGGARFARGEGMWFGNDAVYWACTNGGRAKVGQIWKYTPSPAEGTPAETANPGVLELFLEPNDSAVVENADNLTVAPWGDLVVCEDGNDECSLFGVTPAGKIYRLGINRLSKSEVAGACFSPAGDVLFVNIQHDHMTLAVHGPWRRA